ncbi:MAG: ABC transporter ATP-binding protein, partial [Clostridia bacterium]|nr:ABC transporter ATP-binding protein [Clostridia bacterium]
MELYKIESLSFSYPTGKDGAIKNVSLSINKGDFITVCGKSGCGKTTLLRMLKKPVSPYGNASGSVIYKGENIENVSEKEQICEIGFVMQDPENQVATDKVWHELAFGLESLGYSNWEIRSRVSETASFFGIENLFYKKTSELSGGEKQLLCLASVMVMRPEVIILDEPTSRLDPIAAYEFLHTLKKINDELGTTVILSEQRLDEAFALSNRVIVMEKGEIIADSTPKDVGKILSDKNHEMFFALPVPTRVFCEVCGGNSSPVTVREGKEWLENYVSERGINTDINFPDKEPLQSESAISVKGLYFRYEKGAPDVIKGLELDIKKGEFFSILGGNGSGKTTALSLISGLNKAQ